MPEACPGSERLWGGWWEAWLEVTASSSEVSTPPLIFLFVDRCKRLGMKYISSSLQRWAGLPWDLLAAGGGIYCLSSNDTLCMPVSLVLELITMCFFENHLY